MEAGKLRDWLTFETLDSELDSDGNKSETWLPAFNGVSRMPCQVTALSGRELIAAQGVQSKVTTRIVVRYRPGFSAVMRARGRSAVYNIEAVIPDPGSGIEFVTLLCSSGVNQGGTA